MTFDLELLSKKKADYYGDLHVPFVIAANCMSLYSDPETAVWALYGRDTFHAEIGRQIRFVPNGVQTGRG